MISTRSQVGISSPPGATVPWEGIAETQARRGIIRLVPVSERDVDLVRLLRPPRLRRLEDGQRHASYLELIFDLAFVVAIAQLAHELVLDHSVHGFAVFGAVLLPVEA